MSRLGKGGLDWCGYGWDDLGYRRSIGRDEGEPNIAEVVADVLGYCVVLADFDGLSDPSGVPLLNGDE